jgi:hypothetical protein
MQLQRYLRAVSQRRAAEARGHPPGRLRELARSKARLVTGWESGAAPPPDRWSGPAWEDDGRPSALECVDLVLLLLNKEVGVAGPARQVGWARLVPAGVTPRAYRQWALRKAAPASDL